MPEKVTKLFAVVGGKVFHPIEPTPVVGSPDPLHISFHNNKKKKRNKRTKRNRQPNATYPELHVYKFDVF